MVGIYILICTVLYKIIQNIDLHFFSFHPAPPGCPKTGPPRLPENQCRREGEVSVKSDGTSTGESING